MNYKEGVYLAWLKTADMAVLVMGLAPGFRV